MDVLVIRRATLVTGPALIIAVVLVLKSRMGNFEAIKSADVV